MSDTNTKGPLAMTTDSVTELLDAYDAETTSLPLGHEKPTLGASAYNWRRAIVNELRALYAASPPSPAPAESGAVAAVLGSEDDLHSVAHALDIGSIGAPYRAYQGSVYCDYQSHRIADFQDYGLALAATVLFNNAKAIKAALAALDSPPVHGGGEAMSTELVERERQWCLSCGTITRTGRCDCSDDSPEAQRLVNYADEVSSEARKLSEANTALTAKVALLTEALEWYGERARLARFIHSGGDPARFELSDDGGKRARRALSEPDKEGP